ncbi:helix-turn-helix domain-containing protein [Pedobacter cryoconitis]|uniref:Transcriptional regulator with XRE-family HTH domain n=1 Tax=Pedobacter cryoconitis TaxID=188932 RepID=A0A7X0J7H3_9SPHI|nr:helix-turn-helix transcriptional regulator [Pedobacter cryoconitis]MBB6502388.1 transcriptional regulator with XRE-family HTH domain [Pedobacter cryoconitis]
MIQNIGKKLRAIRSTHCISQKIVADQLGISVTAYSKIETGITDVSFNKVQQIADIYGVSMVDLLRIGEKNSKDEQYPDLKKQLDDLNTRYNDQQKKMIELYEIIRTQKTEIL